jgi:DNA-binding CsgD family transcriptional regulator
MRRSEIAARLHRSPQTISNSLTIAKDKLGARTIAEAVALTRETQIKTASTSRLKKSR